MAHIVANHSRETIERQDMDAGAPNFQQQTAFSATLPHLCFANLLLS
ncbi:MAG: hypothetical protein ACM3JB_18500 [Acidobacteriaceae bacterium]